MRLMLIALVQFPNLKRTKPEAIESGLSSVDRFSGLDGLLYKYYLTGENGGGGVYIWESREKAEAFYNEDWAPRMEKLFGERPTLTLYDNYVVVDNVEGEVRVEGKALASKGVAE